MARLRKENRVLRDERDILKRATAKSHARCNDRCESMRAWMEVFSSAEMTYSLGRKRFRSKVRAYRSKGLLVKPAPPPRYPSAGPDTT